VQQAGLSVDNGGGHTVSGFTLINLAANTIVSVRNASGGTLQTITLGAGYAGELYIHKVG
jgi:hypothetical protein